MSTRKSSLPLSILLLALLIAAALILPAAFTSQGSAASTSVQYTTATPDIAGASLVLPVKYLEVDRHYNYHIPSDEEIAGTKQKLMNEDKFKQKAKKAGQQQAEKELDATLKEEADYLKQKNELGSEKIPLMEIGEHSAYVSKYTYTVDDWDNCTAQAADPVNMFFYDTGYLDKVQQNLFNAGWTTTSWGDTQCAYVSSSRPMYIQGLQKQTIQMNKGYGWTGGLMERDHMRMWDAGFSGDSVGSWSIGAVHHEKASFWEFDHCLDPHRPDGSSFDLAEYHVWNDALGYYPHFFWNGQNGGQWYSCGNIVDNDGIGVGVDIPSNTLSPTEGLAPGQHRYSSDLRFLFVYQTDGNLVLYQGGTAIWNIQRQTSPGSAIMQWDGNFVAYDSGWHPYWASNTAGNYGARLFVQNDGNVVIYNQYGAPIWQTGTCCR